MRSRPMSTFALVAVLVLALAACGGADDASGGGGSEAASAEDGNEFGLVNPEDAALIVCSDSPYQPFEFQEEGEWTGFDVDLVNAIANGLPLATEYRVTPFDAIQSGAALNAGQCDIAASAMTITEERAQNLEFSDPYFDADQSLMVATDDAGTYAALDALSGQRIGVQASTTGQRYAEDNAPDDAEIVEYPDASALFQALQGGEIAAVLQDFPVNAYFATQNDTVTVVERYETGEQYGFAAKKDNTALIEAINEELERLRGDGTYDAIYTEWFGEAPEAAPSEAASEAAGASEGASQVAVPSESGS